MQAKPIQMAKLITLACCVFVLWIPCSDQSFSPICKGSLEKLGVKFRKRCNLKRQQFVQKELSLGKRAVYLKKLWMVFTQAKDQPEGWHFVARIRRPQKVNLMTLSASFSRCRYRKKHNNQGLQDGRLSKLELVVPHNHTSEMPEITMTVNGETMEPEEATIVVKGTVTFDITFLAYSCQWDKCQNITASFSAPDDIGLKVQKSFLCEYYNIDNETLSQFHDKTKVMSINKKSSPKEVKMAKAGEVQNTTQNAKTLTKHRTGCRVYPLSVDPHRDLGMWFMIMPSKINIGQCSGTCGHSIDILGASKYRTGRSILLNSFEMKFMCKSQRIVHCVPHEMDSKVFMYTPDFDEIVTRVFSAIAIKSCRCV